MSARERIPEEIAQLHAYVDGELDPEARREVELRLGQDSEARRAVADYTALRDALGALYGPIADEPVPPDLLLGSRRPRRRWLRWSGALAAGLVIGILAGWGGWQLRGLEGELASEENYVVREAAMAYAVYTPEVRHPVEVDRSQEQHLIAWLTKRLGAPVKAPHLDRLGFELMGGRLLATEEGPGALFMYQDASGRRVTLYVCLNDERKTTSFRFDRYRGVSVFYWLDEHFSYAVAGDLDRSELLRLAEEVYSQVAV